MQKTIKKEQNTQSLCVSVLEQDIDLSENVRRMDFDDNPLCAKIPNSVLNLFLQNVITPLEFKLYSIIFNSENGKWRYSFPSLEELRIITKTSKTKVSESIKNLEQLNLIQINRQGGYQNKNEYITKIPKNNNDTKIINLILKAKKNYQIYKEKLNSGVILKRTNILKKTKKNQQVNIFLPPKTKITPWVISKSYKSVKNIISEKNKQKENQILKNSNKLNWPKPQNYLYIRIKYKTVFSKENTEVISQKSRSVFFKGKEQEMILKNTPAKELTSKTLKNNIPCKTTKMKLKSLRNESRKPDRVLKPESRTHKLESNIKSETPVKNTPVNVIQKTNVIQNKFIDAPVDLIPFLEYWDKTIKPLNTKTNVYKQAVIFLRMLVKGKMYDKCEDKDPIRKPFFELYKRRPIDFNEFKKAVNNFKIILTDDTIHPINKKNIKKLNLDQFIFSINPKTQQRFSYFITSHKWKDPNNYKCEFPQLQNELAGVYVNEVKKEFKYPLSVEEFYQFGLAAEMLMEYIRQNDLKIVQDLTDKEYAYMLYKSLKYDNLSDDFIKISSFTTEATYKRRIPIFLDSVDGAQYIYHKRTMEEIATEMREQNEREKKKSYLDYEGDIIDMTPEGYTIYGRDVWDASIQKDVGFIDDNGEVHYFPEYGIKKVNAQ